MLHLTIQVLLIISFSAMCTASSETVCPNGWIPSTINGKCFQLITTRRITPPEASESCMLMGGTLATIENDIENDYIMETMIKKKSKGWTCIGGSLNDTGFWVWEDGTPFLYTNWGYGEPQLGGSTMFIYSAPYHKFTENYGKWHASLHKDPHYYLCQLRINSTEIAVSNITTLQTDDNHVKRTESLPLCATEVAHQTETGYCHCCWVSILGFGKTSANTVPIGI